MLGYALYGCAYAVLVTVGSRVYRRAMIRTGKRLKLREVLRA